MAIKKIFKSKKTAARSKKKAPAPKKVVKRALPSRKKISLKKKTAPKKKATSKVLPVQKLAPPKKEKALFQKPTIQPREAPPKRVKILIPVGRILTAEGWKRRYENDAGQS